MKILQKSHHKTFVSYERFFESALFQGSGYVFDCDKDGNLINPNIDSVNNFNSCLSGEYNVIDHGIEKVKNTKFVSAIGQCDCGRKVYLDSFTNTCDCGIDYNMSGDRLASREFWGEETNEHWSDCY